MANFNEWIVIANGQAYPPAGGELECSNGRLGSCPEYRLLKYHE